MMKLELPVFFPPPFFKSKGNKMQSKDRVAFFYNQNWSVQLNFAIPPFTRREAPESSPQQPSNAQRIRVQAARLPWNSQIQGR